MWKNDYKHQKYIFASSDEIYKMIVGILDGKIVYGIGVKNMWGIGTPEDLNYYLYKK